MTQLWRAPSFRITHGRDSLYTENRLEWSCPICGVYGAVEAIDSADDAAEAIKSHHDLVSPQCQDSRSLDDVA
jgi:hypothetical protein